MKITIEATVREIHDLINEIQGRGQMIQVKPSESNVEDRMQLTETIRWILQEQDQKQRRGQEEHTQNPE